MTEPRRLLLSGCMLAVVLLAGCTPGAASPQTTPTPSPATTSSTAVPSVAATPTPTPTSTWNATQSAAIKVVEDYFARIHAVMTQGTEVRDILVLNNGRAELR